MAELDAQPAEQTIVAAIIGMARGLGLAVTAEGIETPAQLDRVRALGCDGAQGFLLARPEAPEHIARLLDRPGFEATIAELAMAPAGSATPASAPSSPSAA